MNKAALKRDLEQILTELEQKIGSLDEDQLNAVPFEGSWTPAQLARHLIKSNGGLLHMLNGPVQDTKGDKEDLTEMIKMHMLDFSNRMTAPEPIGPPKRDYQKEKLLQSLEEIRKGILQSVDTLDLSKTCTLYAMPVMGYLTRWEALHFILYHTQRHMHQLKNMIEKAAFYSTR